MIGSIGKLTAVAAGAGAIVWALRRSRRPERVQPEPGRTRPRIVVAGAGFAGISTLEELSRQLPPGAADVTVVDHNTYHLFTPLLYQVSTGAVDSVNLTYPLRRFCATRGFRFICSRVYGVNPVDQVLTTAAGQIEYDYLVLGLGSETNFFGMQEVQNQSYGLKTVPEADQLHRKVIRNFERASQLTDPDERRRLLTFVVVGGGATGVELLGSLHELVQNNMIRYYPEIRDDEVRIILVEASDHVLPGIHERIGEMALERFKRIGIDLRLNTRVAGIGDQEVVTRDGESIPGDVIIWTAGITPSPISAGLPVEKVQDGRVRVDEHLRISAFPSVFALGDSAAAIDPATGEPYPPNAAVAVQEGKITGENLARLLLGEPLVPFRYKPMGELIALGRLRAAAELGPFVFDGLAAWLIWRMVYLSMLMGTQNRAGLILDWIASLFAQRKIVDTTMND